MYDDDQIEHINREAQKIQQEKRRRLEAEAACVFCLSSRPPHSCARPGAHDLTDSCLPLAQCSKDNGRYRRRE